MSSENLVGVIELGNVNIKCLISKINEDNTSEIISKSIANTQGIQNGVIVNIKKASNVIRLCINDAEKKANVSLKKINVVIEQSEFLCTKLSKHRKINGSKIDMEDIEFLLKEGKKQVVHNDQKHSIIHIFNHNYIVDGKKFIEEPIDVYADSLSHEMTFITAPKNNIKNINQAFSDCDIEVERFISSIFALSVKLLKDSELKSGSILIDIGFEKISLGLFRNFALLHSITLPVGINHFIKDISKVCSLSLKDSELIVKKIDFTFENLNYFFDLNDNLKENFFSDSNFRKISKSLMLNIIKSRFDEILEFIEKQIKLIEKKSNFSNDIIITGGGSNLINIDKYFSKFFKFEVKKTDQDKRNDEIKNFNACLGALKILKEGWETEAIPEKGDFNNQKLSFFTKFFGKSN